jgi:prolipoprotein diacylglyceryl transferase
LRENILAIHWDPNPIAISIESIHCNIYWYGILFATGFILGYLLAKYMCKKENLPTEKLDALLFYVFIGTLVGARLFHVCFYQPNYYFNNPVEIICIWKGGLASHGGSIGAILALLYFCYKNPEFKLIWMLDHLCIPTGLVAALIRIGNFMNSEIVGKPTGNDYGIIFDRLDSVTPLHPVQLYESISYFLIFLVLLAAYLAGKDKNRGLFIGIFLFMVFGIRFILEIFKANQAEYEIAMNQWLSNYISCPIFITVGMLLSIPFILVGFVLIMLSLRNKNAI